MNLKTNAKARLTRRALFHADFWAVLHDSISCKKCINVYQIELFAKKLAADYQRQKKAMYQDVSFWVSSCHHLTDKCIMNGFSSPLICTKIAQKREKLPCYSRKFLSCWKRIFRSARPGAGGGTRTHTMSPSTDFESVTSANSITPAGQFHWIAWLL